MGEKPVASMIEAIAYIFTQRCQMLDAARELGCPNAYVNEPRRVKHHVDMLLSGRAETIGTDDDPFVLMSGEKENRRVATYYIDMEGGRCQVRPRGSEEFLAAYAQAALRDDGDTVH